MDRRWLLLCVGPGPINLQRCVILPSVENLAAAPIEADNACWGGRRPSDQWVRLAWKTPKVAPKINAQRERGRRMSALSDFLAQRSAVSIASKHMAHARFVGAISTCAHS